MRALYNLIVKLYGVVIYIASFNKLKAKQWVEGRKKWRSTLLFRSKEFKHPKTIWFHCASYGEFEQGAPLIEAVKKKHTDHNIVITFFSPSGYTAFKDTKLADAVFYLPLDTPNNAKDFIKILKPSIAIFVKYEFWLNYLKQLRSHSIPTYLVSATFKPHHPFFKWYGSIFTESLFTFKTIYLQDTQSQKLLSNINVNHTKVTGDTRFDRVYQNKMLNYNNRIVQNFKGNNHLLIAGSTWSNDDDYIIKNMLNAKDSGFKYVIAPHEIDDSNLEKLYSKLKQQEIAFTTYTNFKEGTDVLVLNCMGELSRLYKYADFSYVGGGFNSEGIHNVLEPTVFGKPSSFYGTNYSKFNEIVDLKAIECVINLNEELTLTDVLLNYSKMDLLEIENKLTKYFKQQSGSTEIVANDIFDTIKSD